MQKITENKTGWFLWMIASVFYSYQYILRVMPNVMFNDLIHQFHIDSIILGQFSGIYYIGYALTHIPIGIMLDRHGPKKIMPCCIFLTVIGLLPIIFAENWIYPLLGRALIGIGSSAAILGTFKIIRMCFTEAKFTRMLSIAVTIGLIGAIYGGGPLGTMCALWGHKMVTGIFALTGLCLVVVTYFVVPDIKTTEKTAIKDDLKAVLRNPKVLLICLSAGFLVGPLEGFADVWGSEFLKQFYHFDTDTAHHLPSLIFIGMCFGAPVLSYIAEQSRSYLGTIISAAFVMLTIFMVLISGILSVYSISIGFIMVGICCAYQILAIYKASTYVPEHLAGLTTAVANMIIMTFGYIIHSSIGFIISSYSYLSTSTAFAYGISVVPFTILIGTIGFSLIAYSEYKNRNLLTNA